jgi:hypothetical protein
MNLNKDIYSIGALVKVAPEERVGRPDSEGGMAFVKSFDEEDLTLDVEYTVTGQESQEVVPQRITAASLATTARRRSPNEATRPSLLSVAHDPNREGTSPNPTNTAAATPKGISAKLLAATKWSSSETSNIHYSLLCEMERNGRIQPRCGRRKRKLPGFDRG